MPPPTEHLRATQFKPGHPGGPGRPKGARHKLGEAFLKTILADFEQHGVQAIEKVRANDPSTYVRTIASILPKELSGPEGEALFTGIKVSFVRAGDDAKS